MTQARVPSGVTTGGQFSAVTRIEPDVTLDDVSTPAETRKLGEPAQPTDRVSSVTGRRIVSLPRRRVPLTPEQTEQMLARIHTVDPDQLWPSRRKAIQEAAEADAAIRDALRNHQG